MAFGEFIDKIIEKKSILIIASIALCFGFLGGHDLWTQEHRWTDIVTMMFLRNDFLHPYLGAVPYYDKPLLSYWLIALVVKVTQSFSTLTVRLPSAVFGLIGLYSAYSIANKLYDKKSAMLFVWMFLSTFFYIFWARTASADIFNVAGILFAVSIYLVNRDTPRFAAFLTFFIAVAVTCLFKGIVAAVVIFMVVGIDILLQGQWKRYLTVSFFAALIFGVAVFCVPFLLSAYYPDVNFVPNQNSGLYLVYKENVLRFVKPFDHKEPFYVYFLYLPLYLFPWIILFVPALINRVQSWSTLSLTSRWVLLSFVALFVFFTISGSRRSYYILSVLPFAMLVIIDWLQAAPRYVPLAKKIAIVFATLLVGFFLCLQPLFYAKYGMVSFLQRVVNMAPGNHLDKNDIVLFGVRSKVAFYLQVPPTSVYDTEQKITAAINQYQASYLASHANQSLPTLIVTQRKYVAYIESHLPGHYDTPLSPDAFVLWGKVVVAPHDIVALLRKP